MIIQGIRRIIGILETDQLRCSLTLFPSWVASLGWISFLGFPFVGKNDALNWELPNWNSDQHDETDLVVNIERRSEVNAYFCER